MKKQHIVFILMAIACFICQSSFAQLPKSMNYQAVLRSDSGGVLVNDTVDVRFTITNNDSIEFSETHFGVKSNPFGVITLQIGAIDTVGFDSIKWNNGIKKLLVEVDNGGGFKNLGENKLLSVPYALYSAGPWQSDTSNVFYTDGRVGIGIDTPQTKLHLRYSEGFAVGGGLTIDHEFSAFDWQIYGFSDFSSNPNRLALVYGGVERGNFDPLTGIYNSTSDKNLKTNIFPMPSILNKILSLEPKTYTYKEDKKQVQRIGFIAQDVEELFPQIVSKDDVAEDSDEYLYHMDYSGFGVLAIQAIKEQQEIINRQQSAIDQLSKELKALKSEIENLKNE